MVAGASWALPCYAQNLPSPSATGVMGLNMVPSARMDAEGTIRGGLSFSDPYAHGFLGFQISDDIYVGIRQSAELSSLDHDPDRFYPGIDGKFEIYEESELMPAVAAGMQSASGHAQMGGEYIAFSKRYKDFDFTAGLGWGRYGSAFQIDNPLKSLSSHFGRDRNLSSEIPVRPENWFTGDKIGIFGGAEYFTPFRGLSVKFDLGADRYVSEQNSFQFDAPPAWSLGANYQMPLATDGAVNIALAMQGLDRIMARLSVSQLIERWRKKPPRGMQVPLFHKRSDRAFDVHNLEDSAERDGVMLSGVTQERHELQANLTLRPYENTPEQLRQGLIHMANHADYDTEILTARPRFLGLRGPALSLQRGDIENAFARDHGSADEIWNGMEIHDHQDLNLRAPSRMKDRMRGFMPFALTLQQDISLSEEDYGVLSRSSLVAKAYLPERMNWLDLGAAMRVNLHDNYQHIDTLRPRAALPVRSDVADFANSFASLDEAYSLLTHSFRPDLHVSMMTGLLEEMYAGHGGEILYRPVHSRLAFGAEGFLAFKRDPDTFLDLGLSGDRVLTGHINAWYDDPNNKVIWSGKIGRYLNEDFGGQIGFEKPFQNGARLSGFMALSDQRDYDLFGGTTHAHHGLRLHLPLGGFAPMPRYSALSLRSGPVGRDIAQSLAKPLDLYRATEGFSLGHLERNWTDITTEPVIDPKN